ncbi:amidase [Paracraurococcus ruber]|uniref:Amidase n=1 Tax=Paracraurococcus ruber TaxID=77675 RepID=A0ABS1D8X0_9PROT|nr:amidase [Paracraurococcus ruber]MBK1662314.1 amidase [Paracraurococcus ruber]TDG13172.1 amidase [Paracraurococcus ruber]
MSDLAFAFASALDLAAAIRARRIGSREALEMYVGRIERLDGRLNAVVVRDFDRARARADAADAALARGEDWGPLHGLPMTVKESFDVAGLPTHWGFPALRDSIAASDALAVQRLRGAGAIIFGKTNVPVALADWQSYNAVHGTTNNPWDLARAPGGSSGGAAAALAAGLTSLELGSDIGASIRNPAHYCGVFGHKPTWGICPSLGHALGGNVTEVDIAVIGPLARSAADLATVLGIIAGPDPIEAAGWHLMLPPPRHTALRDYRIAVMLDDPNSAVDRGVQDAIAALADWLGQQGATVSLTARPAIDTAEAMRVYVHLLRSATSGGIADAAFAEEQRLAAALPPEDDSYRARMLRANTGPHRAWLAANEARHRMRRAWAAFFQDWDLLLCPAAATAAVPHDQQGERWQRSIPVNGRPVPVTDQLFWAGFSGMALLPASVAPVALSAEGLPIGVQIIGPAYGDLGCIDVARLLEKEYRAFVPPPGWA